MAGGAPEQDKVLRYFKNLVVLSIFYGIILGFFYFANLLSIIAVVESVDRVVSILHYDPKLYFKLATERTLYYWLFWFKYKSTINYSYHHFFVIKLFALTISPTILLMLYVKTKWQSIKEFTPYKREEALHGDAHWASYSEIKKIGLFAKDGMLLGEYKPSKYFIIKDYQHVLLFAPTGSGKGVGFVIPNLLFWKESVLVHDIKLENYELTSGYRFNVLKQKCYTWAPADPEGYSHCYNPLDWIATQSGKMVDDVQKIVKIVMPKQEFWENEARSMTVGVILFLIADETKPTTFGEVVRTLRSDDVTQTLAVALDTLGDKIHPVGYMNLSAFLQKAEKERSGVISTANSGLELWSNPLIDKTTSRSDFDIRQFKKDLTTVYVGLTPDNIERLRPLMSMFYQQATAFLASKIPQKDEPYGVMFMMDEFPTVGKLEQFLSGIAYFRGYHVKLFLIVQDTQQLKGTYEDSGMNSFLSNSTYRITFAANNIETAKLISELVGNKTAVSESMNKPKFLDLNPGSRSVHMSHTQRALLLPQEVIGLPKTDQIILIEASPPIRCKKIRYFKDKFFTRKIQKPIPIPKQKPYTPKRQTPKPQNSESNATSSNAANN
jgi:type IV secretion system protein VirD4